MRCRNWNSMTIACVVAAMMTGCGRGPDLAEVRGQIELNGQPMPQLHITFQPVGTGLASETVGPASVGETDANGLFLLQTVATKRTGAVVGEHVVFIVPAAEAYHNDEDDAARLPGDATSQLPRQWRDGSLRFVVPEYGTDAAEFHVP